MMGFDGYGFGLAAFLYFVGTLLLFALVIVLIVLGIRWLLRQDRPAGGPAGGAGGEDPALALLRERFARGEIDAAEYEERRRLLLGG